VEFTSQQGVMGGYYASAQGENERVAQAISEHYRPRFAGDVVPEGVVGKATGGTCSNCYDNENHHVFYGTTSGTTYNNCCLVDGSQASIVARVLLYLFGAEGYSTSESRKSIASYHYPNDLMLFAAYDIRMNTIGPATAFYIGWTDTVPSVFDLEGW
jgi:hypothetical protein